VSTSDRQLRNGDDAKPTFTRRQNQIMALAAQGLPSKQIAVQLGLSIRTIETHLERLYRKNRVPNRGAAIASWLRYGEQRLDRH
jgi:LuxR family maltose regulon positive regulatory protein/two-component system response regulator NreC